MDRRGRLGGCAGYPYTPYTGQGGAATGTGGAVVRAAWSSAGRATSRRRHSSCSNSRSRTTKSAFARPRRPRCRRKASEVAYASYCATARAAGRPPNCRRAYSRATRRARIEPSTYGSVGASQPATAYAGSSSRTVFSSRCRVQTTSQVSSANAGTMNIAYTAKNPYSPNVDEPFQVACMPIASSSPDSGTSTRRMCWRSAESAETPKPMPVSTVKRGARTAT